MTRLLLLASALSLAACSGQDDANTSDKIEVQGQQAAGQPLAAAPQETKGQEFVSAVLGQFDFAAASATQVSERGEPQTAKLQAQQLAATVQAARAELATAAAGLKMEPSALPTGQSDLAVLSSTRGTPLSRAFAQQQVEALTALVGTMRAYKNGGDNAQLRAWAEKHQGPINERLLDIQTLNAELEEANLPADQR